jgi:hypothetical protein
MYLCIRKHLAPAHHTTAQPSLAPAESLNIPTPYKYLSLIVEERTFKMKSGTTFVFCSLDILMSDIFPHGHRGSVVTQIVTYLSIHSW